jgi:hypothetical protein
VRCLATGIAAALALAPAATALAQNSGGRVEVQIDRPRISTEIGGKFTFTSTVVNRGTTPAENLIAHLNILSLRPGVYVDPEDWASQRTRYLRPIPPGGALPVAWHVQAVNTGSFGVYVAVLSEGSASPPATGPTLELTVAERETLGSGGILPLVVGVPALLTLLAVALRLRSREGSPLGPRRTAGDTAT